MDLPVNDAQPQQRTRFLERFLNAPGFNEGYPEQQAKSFQPPRGYNMPYPHPQMQMADPNSQFPMMFAAQPAQGTNVTPIYMCVGMMGAYPGQAPAQFPAQGYR
jgi:hypothetical protein